MKILRTGGRECFENLPIKINWVLTHNCNYRCSYCFFYGKGNTPPPLSSFSTLEQLKTAVNNIASLNRPWYDVTLTGGEPTIHPHIFDVISILHKKLGERLNRILIITNGSRNTELYRKLADLAKVVNITMNISIHTDHVETEHILELIENLSDDVNMNFQLMFNPDKRKMVHEIYDAMFEYRKKYYFKMTVATLRNKGRVDPRYTQEDFAWQEKTIEQFKNLTKSLSDQFPERKQPKHSNPVFRDIEEDGEIKTVPAGKRTSAILKGLLNLGGMYCIAHSALLKIEPDGLCKGMVCPNDKMVCNIFQKDSLSEVRDKLIYPVKCTKYLCGCSANDPIPKFASEEEAKKYVEFAKKRQAELFDEYLAAQTVEKI